MGVCGARAAGDGASTRSVGIGRGGAGGQIRRRWWAVGGGVQGRTPSGKRLGRDSAPPQPGKKARAGFGPAGG